MKKKEQKEKQDLKIVSPEKIINTLIDKDTFLNQQQVKGRPLDDMDKQFGLYIHWPFCASKCPYCDFNSHVRLKGMDEDRFSAAMVRELEEMAALVPTLTPQSLFFGGGTPSLMSPHTIERVIDKAAALWPLGDQVEITIEANPTSADAQRFQGYRQAGVNRLSLGVQSFNDRHLSFLGRLHSADEARQAIALAQSTFERTSFDLMFGLPGQTLDEWRLVLEEACQLAQGHLSLYQLTIEPDTRFAELQQAGKLIMPSSDQLRHFHDFTGSIADHYGYSPYEVSNFSKPGHESLHNLTYWRYGQYLGIGPGAHSRFMLADYESEGETYYSRYGANTLKNPETWLEMVETKGDGLETIECLTPEQEGDELLLMGLRLREGIRISRYESLRGRPLTQEAIANLRRYGFIDITKSGWLRVTPKGFPLLDAVVADLAA